MFQPAIVVSFSESKRSTALCISLVALMGAMVEIMNFETPYVCSHVVCVVVDTHMDSWNNLIQLAIWIKANVIEDFLELIIQSLAIIITNSIVQKVS